MKTAAAALLVTTLYVLHQDVWFWRDARPLVLGALPIGLFYHAAYTVATSCVLVAARAAAVAVASRHGTARGRMIPAAVVFAYLALVLYIGIFAFRAKGGAATPKNIFLAGRSLGPAVFLLSLFGTNMTAFSILGASGHAFANGIVTYGLMASSSALVIPVTLLVIGTRLWALGKRHGFMTPVQMFRDRWECGHIGTAIFAVQAVLLVPYIIIAVMGGGTTLQTVSNGLVPFWLGGAVVSLVVMTYVFVGGMRGTALVNAFQTVLFLAVRRHRRRGGQRGHGRFPVGDGIDARFAVNRAAPDAGAGLAAVLSQLHLHPALVDRVPPYRHLLPDGAPAGTLPEDDHPLPDLHARDLAPVGVSRRRRQPGDGRARHCDQDRGARGARRPRPGRCSIDERDRLRVAGGRRRRDSAAGGGLRAAVARRAARRRGDGRRDGQRLADSRAVDDVHRGRLHLLWRHAPLRRSGAGAHRTDLRRSC